MDAGKYRELASRTLATLEGIDISAKELRIACNAMGLVGEAGEVADLVKKGIFHEHGLDREKLQKELGDVLWYIAALCTVLDLDLSEIMQANIEKLTARYPAGFSAADSVRRVDEDM